MFIKIVCILIFIVLFLSIHKNLENFSENKCAIGEECGSRVGEDNSVKNKLRTIDPNFPTCVGVCINQHTYTKINTEGKNIDSKFIGQLKDKQTEEDVLKTKCGLCISNFYSGLKIMDDLCKTC